MTPLKRALLVLADGKIFEGESFGFEGETSGEVVFNTSLTGYQEILTDPSYCRQIVTFTNPMMGNTGINDEDNESGKPQVAGVIVKEYCENFSNWRAKQSLGEYLKAHRIVAVCGLPTREIVRHIRERGAMQGVLGTGPGTVDPGLWTKSLLERAAGLSSMAGQNLVSEVTCKEAYEMLPLSGPAKKFVIAYDFGIKLNMVRELAARGCRVKVVPAQTPAQEVLQQKPDGVLLSNGPGDPAACTAIIENIGSLIGKVPILGICLGHQLLALALGAKTFKLKFGHRGGNQPVKDLATGRVLITSQNHGFAVDAKNLPSEMEISQLNLNDGTLEGFRTPKGSRWDKKYPILSIQYHPEASPGPRDAVGVFDEFVRMVGLWTVDRGPWTGP